MSRAVSAVFVPAALAVGIAVGVLLSGADETPRTGTTTVMRPATAPPQLAPVPRYISAGALVLQHLAPSAAEVQRSWRLPAAGGVPEQVVVTWARSRGDQQPGEHGLTLWESEGGPWRRLYRFNAPPFRRKGDPEVRGIGVALEDVSGDGHLDLLSWQDLGGTALHGTYRLVITAKGSARQVFRRENDADAETVGMRAGELLIDRAIAASAAYPRSAHPGYRRWRRTSYRWDGRRLVVTSREVVPIRRHIDPLGS